MVQTFLRRQAVERVTGLKRSSLYELMAADEFPKPIKLSEKSVAWIEAEIIDWQKRRIAQRDQAQSKKNRRSTLSFR